MIGNAGLTLVLVWTGTLDTIVTYTEVVIYLFFAVTGISLFLFRRKEGVPAGIYKVWAYPLTPILFIALNLAIAVNGIWEQPRESLLGIAVAAVGFPLYLLSRRIDARRHAA
jgi:APA family basic amino acid/polyamine antiporter